MVKTLAVCLLVLFAIGFVVFYVEYRLLNNEWFHEKGGPEIHEGS